jgi:hypothetical protein
MTTRRTTADDTGAPDAGARARASAFRRWIESGQVEVTLDPHGVGEAASRAWRRRAALAYLSTLKSGPKR